MGDNNGNTDGTDTVSISNIGMERKNRRILSEEPGLLCVSIFNIGMERTTLCVSIYYTIHPVVCQL